jgi:HPt (histidine-containing phosphotransfer) domain-containing protein
MTAFNASIETKDFTVAGEIVHAAKGIAGNLSLTAFFEASAKLMDQLRNGGTPEDADVALFQQLFEDTKQAINDYLTA